jgi:hypothetical protein
MSNSKDKQPTLRKRIIKLSRTTDNQLMELANSLGVKVNQIDFNKTWIATLTTAS